MSDTVKNIADLQRTSNENFLLRAHSTFTNIKECMVEIQISKEYL